MATISHRKTVALDNGPAWQGRKRAAFQKKKSSRKGRERNQRNQKPGLATGGKKGKIVREKGFHNKKGKRQEHWKGTAMGNPKMSGSRKGPTGKKD